LIAGLVAGRAQNNHLNKFRLRAWMATAEANPSTLDFADDWLVYAHLIPLRTHIRGGKLSEVIDTAGISLDRWRPLSSYVLLLLITGDRSLPEGNTGGIGCDER